MASAGSGKKKLSKLQAKLAAKLSGSKFRWLNEQMYTTPGADSFELLQGDPALFDEYHAGFAAQVKSWPVNPLDLMIRRIGMMPATAVVADFGCGEARLAASVIQKTHSFDLVAANDRITACDIANVPLPDASVDVAVFCLALMGTNYFDFLREAKRVLRDGGLLLVAEVVSRFNAAEPRGAEGGDEADAAEGGGVPPPPASMPPPLQRRVSKLSPQHQAGVAAFLQALSQEGFIALRADDSNTHFIHFILRLRDGGKPPSVLKKRGGGKARATAQAAEGGPTAPSGEGATKSRKRPRKARSKPSAVNGAKKARPFIDPPALKPCIYKRR